MRFSRWMVAGALAAVGVWAQNEPSGRVGGTPAQAQYRDSKRARRANDLDVPSGAVTVHGILIDAGCRDTESWNLRRPPETLEQEAPAQPANAARNNPPQTGAVSAQGVSVDAGTIDTERTGVMEEHVQGMFERQSDPTCAVTGSTTLFAVLTDNGRLLDLDQGGNTLAIVAVQSTSDGRAMLNGQGAGVKPRVIVQGQLRGDRFVTQNLKAGS